MLHREWIHICWLNNGTTSKAFINGNLSSEQTSTSPFTSIAINKTAEYSMIIGQEPDSLKGDFDPNQSMRGKMSEFNIWNYTLSSDTITEMSKCKSVLKGNIVTWEKEYITFHGINPVLTSVDEFCAPFNKLIFVPDSMNYNDAENYCRIHKGYIFTPFSRSKNNWLVEMTHKSKSRCSKASWINILAKWDDKIITGTNNTFNNWLKLKEGDTCGFVGLDGMWGSERSDSCDFLSKCFACAFDHEPVFTLKGFCLNFMQSYNYYIDSDENRIQYLGYKGSSITRSERGWKLLNERGEEIVWTIKDDHNPLGRKTWLGTSEECKLSSEEILLTFSACNMKHSFTCNSGQCIDIDKYCNNHLDCNDGSDEDDCMHIFTDKIYSIYEPPNAEIMNNSMFIAVDIIQFDNIDSLKMTMTLTMDLKISWKDPRLLFKGLTPYKTHDIKGTCLIVLINILNFTGIKNCHYASLVELTSS